MVTVLPITAWLAARFGRKRYLVASVLLFIVASFFCGTSRTLGDLVFWRVLQGVGGAALLSTAQATLLEIFPASQQSMVRSILGLGVVVDLRVLRDKSLTGGYGLAQAKSGAMDLIDQAVQAQAQTLAYNNAFLLIGIVFVFIFPAVFLLKKPGGNAASAGSRVRSPTLPMSSRSR